MARPVPGEVWQVDLGLTDALEYLAGGMTHEGLLSEFPDIRACLAFAAERERKLAALPA